MNVQHKKKLLVLSPESILPPGHGGSLRSASLISGLSRVFDITAIVPQAENDINTALEENPDLATTKWVSAFSVYSQGKRSVFRRIRGRFDRFQDNVQRKRWANVVRDWYFGPLFRWNEVLKEQLNKLRPDVVMIEHTRHAETLRSCKKIAPQALMVVNSQNVESELVRQMLQKSLDSIELERICKKIENVEQRLGGYTDMLWMCSNVDRQRYVDLGVKVDQMTVIPNGVDTHEVSFRPFHYARCSPSLLFVGSLSYEPNIDGVLWFHREVWPALKASHPEIKWKIVGRWPSNAIHQIAERDTSIHLHSNVPSTMPYLREATLAICPLFSGGGTRLKILEAFSAGLPVVATSTGAEGLNVESAKHLLIADTASDFIAATKRVLLDTSQFEQMRHAARRLVQEEYDWKVIASAAINSIHEALEKKAISNSRKQCSDAET